MQLTSSPVLTHVKEPRIRSLTSTAIPIVNAHIHVEHNWTSKQYRSGMYSMPLVYETIKVNRGTSSPHYPKLSPSCPIGDSRLKSN